MFRTLKNALDFGKSLFSSGIRAENPLIIFESDDWGCIRMPSKKTKGSLTALNPEWVNDPYLQFDNIESESDLEILFNLLSEHKDADGNPPVLTANCIGMNPDFDTIKNNGFSSYSNEDFRTTFSRNAFSNQSYCIEKEALKQRLFVPQFHGREHVQVSRWMQGLRNKNELLRTAFTNRMISLRDKDHGNCTGFYMDALNPVSPLNLNEIIQITHDGLKHFKSVWGYNSESMIAPCYFWHPELETHCSRLGVKIFQGLKYQFVPTFNKPPYYSKVFHYAGEKRNGVMFNIRNAFFEPSTKSQKDWVSYCLKDIAIAVERLGYATISVHRLNFIGSIETINRERNLKMFNELLIRIKKLFPNVKYISTPELLSYWDFDSDVKQ